MGKLGNPETHRIKHEGAQPISPEESIKTCSIDEEIKLSSPEVHEIVESIPQYNKRALRKNDSTYKLETFDKNYLVIFNQEKIIGYDNPRVGTDIDAEALEKTFSKYNFEVHRHKDFTKRKILEELNKFKTKDFTDYGCVAVAVLTHGTYDGLIRAKDQLYSEMEIINYFKTHDKPTLVTKPKLLIIQACRGRDPSQAVHVNQEGKTYTDDADKENNETKNTYTLPIESDMLVLHSSYMGKPSHRVDLYGSWFIQTLCREIVKLSSTVDIESMMTEVKKAVAIDMEYVGFNSVTGNTAINKQMPVMSSSLIRKLYLKKFEGSTTSESSCDGEVATPYIRVLDRVEPKRRSSAQLERCSCFSDPFNYLKHCLTYFVKENPNDDIAKSYLRLCATYKDTADFHQSKETMSGIISKYLEENVPERKLNYLYLYKSY